MPTRSTEAVGAPDEPAVDPTTRPSRAPRELSPATRIRRAVTLLVITCVVPGSAQIAAGNRRWGRLLMRAWVATVGAALLLGLLLLVDRPFALVLMTSPVLLVLGAVGCFAAAVAMVVAIGDAWRLGRTALLPARPRWGITAFALVLALVSGGVLVGGGRRLWAAADVINGIFGSGRVSAAADGRFNVLLLGGDAGPDRVGTRPDSMTLASIDADTGRTVLFSLPRNLEDIPFAPGSQAARAKPEGWSCGDGCLLNGIYTWGSEHRAVFPGARDPGAEAMKQAVEGITGLHVNYYVLIDLRGFSSLIDALGGIRLTVNKPVPIGGGTSKVSGYIQPGTQTLDGYHALWFARSRHGANDYERMARQRCVMDAMVHQLDPQTVLGKFEGIAAASKQVVSTDVPQDQLATFLELAAKAKSQKISSVQFVPPLIEPAHPDFGRIRGKVRAAIDAAEHPKTSADGAATSTATAHGSPSGSGSAGAPAGDRSAAAPAASPSPEASDISAICRPA